MLWGSGCQLQGQAVAGADRVLGTFAAGRRGGNGVLSSHSQCVMVFLSLWISCIFNF